MLNLRTIFRPFLVHKVGNGDDINAWEDSWLSCGTLIPHISYRRIFAAGFNDLSNARMGMNGLPNGWPTEWVEAYPLLANTPIPVINEEQEDVITWKNKDNALVSYTVKDAWESLEGPHDVVDWTKAVWFKGFIPKHAFCLWVACHNRLATQDRISSWKHEPPDWKCIFCGIQPDSVSHLFFECPFTQSCWKGIQDELGLHGFANDWNGIKDTLCHNRLNTTQKLAIAAAVYAIWKERNRRLFGNVKRIEKKIAREVRDVVIARVAWKRKRKLATVFDD